MAIEIKIKGQEDTNEYKAGLELKKLFQSEFSNDLDGEILIVTNVTLFGQEIKDVDIVVVAKLGKGFKRKLKFRPSGEDVYVQNFVYFSNFCFTIELKNHGLNDVSIGNMNNVLVTYHGKRHDVTYQSEKQKYSLNRYFKNVPPIQSNVFVTNFIWLKNIETKDLNKIKSVGEHNILPKQFNLDWLLMLLLSQNKPYKSSAPKSGNSYYGFNCWGDKLIDFKNFEIALNLFDNVKKNVGTISRNHFERISKRLLKEQKYAEAILNTSEKDGKFVIIQGKAGTGKTVKFLNIACDLCLNHGCRCLILTYNFTLVADIRRTLTFAHIPDGVGRESVRIMTLYKFFIDLFEAFDVYSNDITLDDEAFFANYPRYCQDLLSFIIEKRATNENIEEVLLKNHHLISWDYILIDEAQDWNPYEVDILYQIFGPSRIVIAQAPDQKIRELNDPRWVKPKWRVHRDYEQTSEKKSFRQKSNLVNFINQFAEKFNLNWELEPNNEFTGGKVIINTSYDMTFHNKLYDECYSNGNRAYEMLFLVPPSKVVKDGLKYVTIHGMKKEVKLRHCSLINEYPQINFWDGTNKELRKDYPIKIDQHRLIQYESCRGLEGWTVVCIELDEFIKHLNSKYLKEENSDFELALESPEEKKHRYVYMWALIPLTRAIDTLVITIKDTESKIGQQLKKIYEENKTFIEWH